MRHICSTKLLDSIQKEILQQHPFRLTEYKALDIEYITLSLPSYFDHYIFTSQHGVRSFLKYAATITNPDEKRSLMVKSCFCVGAKTASFLQQNGLRVEAKADNARALGELLVRDAKDGVFLFICGDIRMDSLPEILKENSVSLHEVLGYRTHITARSFEDSFDGVLFFSPSGVRSFTAANELGTAAAFCIGPTTAREALKFTEDVTVSNEPTVEALLEKVVETYIIKS